VSAILCLPVYLAWFWKFHTLWSLRSDNCITHWNAIVYFNYLLIFFVTLASTIMAYVGLTLLWLVLPLAIQIVIEQHVETEDQRKVLYFLLSCFYDYKDF
jgi:hypothetical protein